MGHNEPKNELEHSLKLNNVSKTSRIRKLATLFIKKRDIGFLNVSAVSAGKLAPVMAGSSFEIGSLKLFSKSFQIHILEAGKDPIGVAKIFFVVAVSKSQAFDSRGVGGVNSAGSVLNGKAFGSKQRMIEEFRQLVQSCEGLQVNLGVRF